MGRLEIVSAESLSDVGNELDIVSKTIRDGISRDTEWYLKRYRMVFQEIQGTDAADYRQIEEARWLPAERSRRGSDRSRDTREMTCPLNRRGPPPELIYTSLDRGTHLFNWKYYTVSFSILLLTLSSSTNVQKTLNSLRGFNGRRVQILQNPQYYTKRTYGQPAHNS